VRKICAYAAWPKKHAWRLYNKSLVFLSKTFAPGFATWGLFDASEFAGSVFSIAHNTQKAFCPYLAIFEAAH
jgi:hypothetical protein